MKTTASKSHLPGRAAKKQKQVDAQTSVQLAGASVALLRLQREYGNRFVQRVVALSRRDEGNADVTPEVEQTIQGGGQALDSSVRAQMEPAAGTTVSLPLRNVVHPIAVALAQPGIRFRLPTFNDLKAAYTDKDLKIPEKVIQDRVGQLLGRMKGEGRLKTKDDVPTIIAKIFPAPGKIDETEFNKAIDVSDRSKIYESVFEASTKVKPIDKPGLQVAMKDAADLITKVQGDAAGLTAVFGTKASMAKVNYGKARKALEDVSKHMDARVSTDYNLDDPEVGLGGWADFGAKHMHLLADVVKGTDLGETKATLIHEASHLADSSVDDRGYYGTPGFEAMTDVEKVGNAGHYEELPRRLMGNSSYLGVTFTPGVKKGGGAVTREDKIKRDTSEYLRKAWDAAVDTHTFIRAVRKEKLSGNGKPFTDNNALIMEISKLMDLTIHEQAAGKAEVTTLDVTLTESIAHGVSLVGENADKIPFPSPIGALTDVELRDKLVDAGVTKYGNLLKDAKRDKALLDWLVAHYHSLPGV